MKCKNCNNLKKRYIPAWDSYAYHCEHIGGPFSEEDLEEIEEKNDECKFFIEKEKARKKVSRGLNKLFRRRESKT